MDKLKSLTRVEENFNKLPSVGKKSAERMAYALLDMSKEEVEEFYNSIKDMKEKVHTCPICGFLRESEVCPICGDASRDQTTLIVVSYPKDVLALSWITDFPFFEENEITGKIDFGHNPFSMPKG